MSDQDIPSLNAQLATHREVMPASLPGMRALRESLWRRLDQSGLDDQSVQVGEQAPDFTLPNVDSQPVTLSALLKSGPVVVVFYREDWCPFYNFTLCAYQAILPQITQMYHATLVAISLQKPDYSVLTAQHKGLTYLVLSDSGNVVAERYRVVWTLPAVLRIGSDTPEYNGDNSYRLPMPATFVIDQAGIVRLALVHADRTKRTEPTEIVAALHDLKY